MSEFDPNNFKHQFEEIISSGDNQQLCEFLDHQNISDVAELIYEHPEDETLIISCMSIHRAASVFKILELSNQKSIIKELPPHKTAALLNALPPDDRTDFLEELPSNVVRELIKLLNTEERKIALSLLGYPENSVGFGLLALFLILRFINNYGDPVPWSHQPRGSVFSFLSFINVNKYPPSLDFLCVTIGGGLIALALFEAAKNKAAGFFKVYGRVPMFYYILHLYLIHLIGVIVFFAEGFSTASMKWILKRK